MPSQFFRVDGADQETGQDTYLVLQADTKPQAEKLARQQGLLISSVRVAKPADWAEPAPNEVPPDDTEMTQHIEAGFYEIPTPTATEHQTYEQASVATMHQHEPEPLIDTAPTHEAPAHYTAASGYQEHVAAPSAASAAAAIILACVGAALVIGGVLALTLALWPDNAVRNELQQIDFRLHEVSQTIVGGMLVLGGLITLAMAMICYLLPRRSSRA